MQAEIQSSFDINRLIHSGCFPHPTENLEIIETHISWVILTGEFAYKIKKPIKFDFVDYSTLQLRKLYCEKELALNSRLAPDIYVDVVPISDVEGELRIGDESNPVQYAVRMRQFLQSDIVAARLKSNRISAESVEAFGQDVAKFHQFAPAVDVRLDCVQTEQIGLDSAQNFSMLLGAFAKDRRQKVLADLEAWAFREYERLVPTFDRRLDSGHVRLCHGDMHLNNIVQQDKKLFAFDGIEFNEQFQWIDCISEVAFTVMDFTARGRPDLGWAYLNSYLEASGDYGGLAVLRYYAVYRAMVRAKVTWLNPKNHQSTLPDEEVRYGGPWDKYILAAKQFAFAPEPSLAITHGLSGSGKTRVAKAYGMKAGAILVRSDVERHRIAELPKRPREKYGDEMNAMVFQRLHEIAALGIVSGFSVIVDATFLKEKTRSMFRRLAKRLYVNFRIIDCHAEFDELCRRINNRVGDASEATVAVLKRQIETQEPLTFSEQPLIYELPPCNSPSCENVADDDAENDEDSFQLA